MMFRILLFLPEFICSFVICNVVSVELLKESVNYLILCCLILLIRWISAKIEKRIEKYNKKEEKNV